MARQLGEFFSANAHLAFREAHLEAMTGIRDPHLHLFITEWSRKRMKIAAKMNPETATSLIVRFMHFSARMAAAAADFDQLLILGAGFDTRPLWWPGLAGTDALVIEVDLPDVIEAKRTILGENGIATPANLVALGCDLGDPHLPARLIGSGYDPDRPVAVFLEGLTFFLLPEITVRLIEPATLRLASGSRIHFDFQSHAAIDARNRKEARIGSPVMFRQFPFPDDPAALRETLTGLGYADVEISSIGDLARRRWPERDFASLDDDARVVEATRR